MPLPEQEPWEPEPLALWSEFTNERPDDMSGSLVLRHPTEPYVRALQDGEDAGRGLQEIATAYLKGLVSPGADRPAWLDLVRDACGEPIPQTLRTVVRVWIQALAGENESIAFSWLPLRAQGDSERGPMASFWFGNTTAVLLASERLASASDPVFLASGFGLRVVAHVHPEAGGGKRVRITGFTASLPFGKYATAGLHTIEPKSITRDQIEHFLAQAADTISRSLLLERAVFKGLRLCRLNEAEASFEATGTSFDAPVHVLGGPGEPPKEPPYGRVASRFYVRGTGKLDLSGALNILSRDKMPMVADMADGFPRDPASAAQQAEAGKLRARRPSRDDQALQPYKEDVARKTPAALFHVERARGWADSKGGEPAEPAPGALRSNAFSESSSTVSLDACFRALKRSGIGVSDWLRHAQPRLRAFYRSGIRPGPGKDGDTVNARVYLGRWGADFFAPSMNQSELPRLSIHLALADRRHRQRKLPHPAQSMSIGADARWVWHEFGHVVLAASVGELEFRFAHSAGDALAAIACDPGSSLLDHPLRGATFPWVYVPRRHDREASRGWSWGGSLYRSRALCAHPDRVRRRGYLSEQILSSSLFRLYRCLGGDTLEHARVREAASDYTVHLIVRAISLLGYAGAVPAHTPEHLVSALVDADIGSATVTLAPWAAGDADVVRVGGCAHKVIRWAFEQQGLFGAPGKLVNGPGLPPPVDVYIADRRSLREAKPYGETVWGPGHYAPTPLSWDPSGQGAWYGADAALRYDGQGFHVTLGNRGRAAASNVTLRVFVAPYDGSAPPPHWKPQSQPWTLVGQQVAASIPPNQTAEVGPFVLPQDPGLANGYLLFAEASCAADRANTDVATNLPCSAAAVALVDLVPADNNLALWVRRPAG